MIDVLAELNSVPNIGGFSLKDLVKTITWVIVKNMATMRVRILRVIGTEKSDENLISWGQVRHQDRKDQF